MAHRERRIVKALLIGVLVAPGLSQAGGLEPMSNEEMGDVTGQSMLGVDVATTDDADFTRYTIGMESEMQMNMEEMALGEDGEGADVGIDHLSLGHIAREDGTQFDGNEYNANDIVPFVGMDPYFEMAQNDGDVVGFRLGFTEARGTLSGDISALTGRLGMEVEDEDGDIHDGQLLQDDGSADNQRATHFGLEDEDGCGDACVALNTLQTLEVGDRDDDGNADFTNDFFISFQQEGMEWQSPGDSGEAVETDAGVFFNIPTAMQVDLQQIQDDGLQRSRTEYIDRGEGLF